MISSPPLFLPAIVSLINKQENSAINNKKAEIKLNCFLFVIILFVDFEFD